MGLDPLPPVHMRAPEPDPLPLRVDVINGWPLSRPYYYYAGLLYRAYMQLQVRRVVED